MKRILFLFLAFMLVGCDSKPEKIYIDANGTVIPQYKRISFEYACDDRGYMYYKQHTYENNIYLPLFENFGITKEHTRQVMCK